MLPISSQAVYVEASAILFHTDFLFLALGTYDGILGLDWSAANSLMLVDCDQKWITLCKGGKHITLRGSLPMECATNVVYISAIGIEEMVPVSSEVQQILNKYQVVLANPEPPQRRRDHVIPLILGSRHVYIRPYRVAPHLKMRLNHK